ncbi:dual specificity protein phosphatase 13A-like isoform X1 [Vanacampus margaritifer]
MRHSTFSLSLTHKHTHTHTHTVLSSACEEIMSGCKEQQDLALIKQLELILDSCTLELTVVDEVWPNLYIGNIAVAQNKKTLSKLGITHVLNAAHSKQGSVGDQRFYGNACVYCGIPAEDSNHFDLSQYFKPAADFIHKGLKDHQGKHVLPNFCICNLTSCDFPGKVLVHCIMGVSRSATLALAYLMLRQRLSLLDALRHLVLKRAIYPNRNFLMLLHKLNEQLAFKRRLCPLL